MWHLKVNNYLLRERYKQNKDDNPLTSNEYRHDVSNEQQFFREEE